jgi:hypothetical protein
MAHVPRMSLAVGRLEQLVDVGQSDPALRGLNDHASDATTGSGPTRQYDARDSEPPLVSVAEGRAGYYDCLT